MSIALLIFCSWSGLGLVAALAFGATARRHGSPVTGDDHGAEVLVRIAPAAQARSAGGGPRTRATADRPLVATAAIAAPSASSAG